MTEVTVDVVIFTIVEHALSVLLVQRGHEPDRGAWAIPGGFVRDDESLDEAALRELREETGVADVYLEQLYTFGEPRRDPRRRIVTVAYYALIATDRAQLAPGTDTVAAQWWPVAALPEVLAFDHAHILAYAIQRLRAKIGYTNIGFELLPAAFSLTELQSVYEAILGRTLDKRNFRKRIEQQNVVEPLDEWRRAGASRPARLYRFRSAAF